jgi:hypothetical protein
MAADVVATSVAVVQRRGGDRPSAALVS